MSRWNWRRLLGLHNRSHRPYRRGTAVARVPVSSRSVAMLGAATAAVLMMTPQMAKKEPRIRMPVFLRGALNEPAPMNAPPSPRFLAETRLGADGLIDRWQPFIKEASDKFKVPAAWIRAVMRTESGGRTVARDGAPITSSTGAQGVMQLMPQTYVQMAHRYRLGTDPADPRDNILAGAAYLRWLHSRYGSTHMFAAYNDGPGHIDAHLHHGRPLPVETKNYMRRVATAIRHDAGHRPNWRVAKFMVPSGPMVIDATGGRNG